MKCFFFFILLHEFLNAYQPIFYDIITINSLQSASDILEIEKNISFSDLEEATKVQILNPSSIQDLQTCLAKQIIIQKSGEAALQLGKYYLFGFPKVQNDQNREIIDCSSYSRGFEDDLHLKVFQTNFHLDNTEKDYLIAMNFFLLGHQLGQFKEFLIFKGSQDSSFFIIFLIRMGSIYKSYNQIFDQSFYQPENLPRLFLIFNDFLNEGIERNSLLTAALIFSTNNRCQSSIKSHIDVEVNDILQQSNRNTLFSSEDGFEVLVRGLFNATLKEQEMIFFLHVFDKEILHEKSCLKCEEIIMVAPIITNDYQLYIQETLQEEHQDIYVDDHFNPDVAFISQTQLKQQAELGNLNAQIQLAQSYMFGNPNLGIEPDRELAQYYYNDAANQNNPQANYILGILETEKNETDYQRAIRYFEKSIELGSADGYNGLGYLYLNGLGVPENKTKGVDLIKQGMKHGSIQSMYNIALFQINGDVMPRNTSNAIEILKMILEIEDSMMAKSTLVNLYLREPQLANLTCTEASQYLQSVIPEGGIGEFNQKGMKAYLNKQYEEANLQLNIALLLGMEEVRPHLRKIQQFLQTDCMFDDCGLIYAFEGSWLNQAEMSVALADQLYFSEDKINKDNITSDDIYQTIWHLYEKSTSENAYALYSLSYMSEQGLGIEKNLTLAKELNDLLIQRARKEFYPYQNIYPAYLNKLKMIIMSLFT